MRHQAPHRRSEVGFPTLPQETNSMVGGGVGNQASGDDCTVAGGRDNMASGLQSAVPGGDRQLGLRPKQFCGW